MINLDATVLEILTHYEILKVLVILEPNFPGSSACRWIQLFRLGIIKTDHFAYEESGLVLWRYCNNMWGASSQQELWMPYDWKGMPYLMLILIAIRDVINMVLAAELEAKFGLEYGVFTAEVRLESFY